MISLLDFFSDRVVSPSSSENKVWDHPFSSCIIFLWYILISSLYHLFLAIWLRCGLACFSSCSSGFKILLFFFFPDITSWDLNIRCYFIQSFPLYLSFKSCSLCLSSKMLSFIISNNNLSYISCFKYRIFFTFKSFIPLLSCLSFLHLLPLHSCFSLNFWTINRTHLEALVY